MRELSSFGFLMILLAQVATAEGDYNSEQYENELNITQQSLQDARVQIAIEQNRIAELKREIAVIDEKKARFFSESGFSEADVEAALHKMDTLCRELKKIMQSRPDSQTDSVLNECSSKISALKLSPMAALKRVSIKISEMDNLLKSVSRLDRSISVQYSSVAMVADSAKQVNEDTSRIFYIVKSNPAGRETLFNIAKSVYGDPNRWPEIYFANKRQIDSGYFKNEKRISASDRQIQPADFILPGQVLIIPIKKAD